jgi:hypothetical protein
MDIVKLSYHGLYSKGYNLSILDNRLEFDLESKGLKVAVAQTDYPVLGAIAGIRSWNRKVVPLLFLESLAKYRYKFPGAKIWASFHSNATLGIMNALAEYKKNRHKYDPIKIDRLFLFGCVMPRKFDWGIHPEIEVHNFVGSNDRVSSMARLWFAGNSGQKGFKIDAPNLKQYYTKWKHSDFVLPENYEYIRDKII